MATSAGIRVQPEAAAGASPLHLQRASSSVRAPTPSVQELGMMIESACFFVRGWVGVERAIAVLLFLVHLPP